MQRQIQTDREAADMEKSKSGETIVEVLVSAVIFLLLMAVLQGAVMFSHSAQQKSGRLRENDAAMLQALAGGRDYAQFGRVLEELSVLRL